MLRFIRAWWDGLTQVGVPVLFLAVDLMVRSVLGISVADAGADMALTSFAGLITLAIDDAARSPSSAVGPALLLAMAAFVFWLASLIAVANTEGPWTVILAILIGLASMAMFVWLFRDVLAARRLAT